MYYIEEAFEWMIDIFRWTAMAILIVLAAAWKLFEVIALTVFWLFIWGLIAEYVTGNIPIAGFITVALVILLNRPKKKA